MESDARPPEKLTKEQPMSQNWKRWKKMFSNYMKLTGSINKPEDEQVAWLKNFIGPVGLEAFESMSFENPEDEDNLSIVLEKLDLFFDPPKNEVEERYKFFVSSKKNFESIEDFVERLKKIAMNCNFGEQMENRIIDTMILDIKDKHLRNLIFEEKDLTLRKLQMIYKSYEINTAKMKEVSKEVIPEKQKIAESKTAESKNSDKKFVPRQPRPAASSVNRDPKNCCWKCGKRHPPRECPAFKVVCCHCNQMNHFPSCCPVLKFDKSKVTENNASVKNENFSSPFQIDKDFKADKNNLSSPANDKNKNYVKLEYFQSGPVLKNFETINSGNPKKVQNQFSCPNNFGENSSNAAQVTSHPPLNPRFNHSSSHTTDKYSHPPRSTRPPNSNIHSNRNNRQRNQSKQQSEGDCVIS